MEGDKNNNMDKEGIKREEERGLYNKQKQILIINSESQK